MAEDSPDLHAQHSVRAAHAGKKFRVFVVTGIELCVRMLRETQPWLAAVKR